MRVALQAFDDRREPVAELWRRVNDLLESLGIPRVSYGHLLRLVHELREEEDVSRARRRELARICRELYGPKLVG